MDIKLTDENFDKEVSATDKFVLVDFFAVWCEPCSVLGPILERVMEHFKEKVILIKANVDSIPATSQKFGVERIPTVVLFKDGKPVNGFIGLLPEKTIKSWLENAIEEQANKSQNKK